ncbi:MAG: hypothetical protein JO264_08175 [Acidisphaera sp.]|nr:hypothetical protein [Acidisphaera sp.]
MTDHLVDDDTVDGVLQRLHVARQALQLELHSPQQLRPADRRLAAFTLCTDLRWHKRELLKG